DPDDSARVADHVDLADTLLLAGRLDEAHERYELAISLAHRYARDDETLPVPAWIGQAEIARRRGDLGGAAATFERGMTILERHESGHPLLLARARLGLARCLSSRDRDRARALAMAAVLPL